MAVKDWPQFKDMNWLRLLEGPSDHVERDMAPTMKNLTYRGERYFRMPGTRGSRPAENAEGRTVFGGCYLWTGWAPWRKETGKAADPVPPQEEEG